MGDDAPEKKRASSGQPRVVPGDEDDEEDDNETMLEKSLDASSAASGQSAEEEKLNRKPKAVKRNNSYKKGGIKKPQGTPRRPLSAYNIFFKEQREVVIEERTQQLWKQQEESATERRTFKKAKISFEELAKEIGARWKSIDPQELNRFQAEAERDSQRYKAEMEIFSHRAKKEQEKQKQDEPVTRNAKRASPAQSDETILSSVQGDPSSDSRRNSLSSGNFTGSTMQQQQKLHEETKKRPSTRTSFELTDYLHPSPSFSNDVLVPPIPLSEEQVSRGFLFGYTEPSSSIELFASSEHHQQQQQQQQHNDYTQPGLHFSASSDQNTNDQQLLRRHQEQFLLSSQQIHTAQMAATTEASSSTVNPFMFFHSSYQQHQLPDDNQCHIPLADCSISILADDASVGVGMSNIQGVASGFATSAPTEDHRASVSTTLDSTDLSWMEPRPLAPGVLVNQAQLLTKGHFSQTEYGNVGSTNTSEKDEPEQRLPCPSSGNRDSWDEHQTAQQQQEQPRRRSQEGRR